MTCFSRLFGPLALWPFPRLTFPGSPGCLTHRQRSPFGSRIRRLIKGKRAKGHKGGKCINFSVHETPKYTLHGHGKRRESLRHFRESRDLLRDSSAPPRADSAYEGFVPARKKGGIVIALKGQEDQNVSRLLYARRWRMSVHSKKGCGCAPRLPQESVM